MSKIVAVLVTYNPNKDYLIKDINSFIDEVDKIIICNNSEYDLEDEVEIPKIFLDKIEIINFYDNLGIAKAQNIGMKKAFKDGADFVLQMDQDSIFEGGSVTELKESYFKLKKENVNVGIIGGLTLDIEDYKKDIEVVIKKRKKDKLIYIGDNVYKSVKAIISSGSLIPKEIYYSVGDMMEELFIDLVDTEYCWRLIKNNYKVIQNLSVKMYHQTGSGHVSYRGKKYLVSAPIRNYYQTRNELYLLKLSYAPFSWKINVLKRLYRKLYLFPKIMNEGSKRKEYSLKGLRDWKEKKMGKYEEYDRK